MKRSELIQSDEYWRALIETGLYHKNYKGKNRRDKLVKDVLKLKNELIIEIAKIKELKP